MWKNFPFRCWLWSRIFLIFYFYCVNLCFFSCVHLNHRFSINFFYKLCSTKKVLIKNRISHPLKNNPHWNIIDFEYLSVYVFPSLKKSKFLIASSNNVLILKKKNDKSILIEVLISSVSDQSINCHSLVKVL